ncbi:MAG: MotA/TolQ/ExbB proton channel family protein [Spirochaetes bacterium]|nr:MotA/TolQ/ExbB proton channel family protein [Spirochaetota bacterium]
MIDFIVRGGIVMWFIVALALVATAIIIERLLYLRRISKDENKLFKYAKTSLQQGHFQEALAICDNNLSPFSTLLKAGIENKDQPESLQKEMIRDAASQEEPKLQRGLWWLGSICTIAPLLGLLGTVTGTMRAFGVLGKFGAVSDPTTLASGVSEALITTVGGIVVAVPTTLFYNYFVTKVNMILNNLESQVNTLVQSINASIGGASTKDPSGGK